MLTRLRAIAYCVFQAQGLHAEWPRWPALITHRASFRAVHWRCIVERRGESTATLDYISKDRVPPGERGQGLRLRGSRVTPYAREVEHVLSAAVG